MSSFKTKYLPLINLVFTITFIGFALINHNLVKEWKFVMAFEIALILNLLRLTALKEVLYKTQQYVITSGLMGLLIFNVLLLKVHEISDKTPIDPDSIHYPNLDFGLSLVFMLVLVFHPKNEGA